MNKVISIPPRPNPRVTFSALADVLTSPTHRIPGLLQPQKYPKPGPVFGYKKTREQLAEWLTNGTPLNPNAPSLREHEAYALGAALSISGGPSSLLPSGTTSTRDASLEPTWLVAGVEVSFSPDLIVTGTVGKTQATGAIKLYMRKEPLSVGPMLAALLYYHRAQVANDATADPSLCGVTDVQAGIVYTATGSYQRLVSQVQNACQVIAAVWPTL